MRPFLCAACILLLLSAAPGHADLQTVAAGGKIELFGGWYSEFFEPGGGAVRLPGFHLPGRPVGTDGTVSAIRTGKGGNNLEFVEMRTRLHVTAEFSQDLTAFVELDSIDEWGQDFRSDYRTGADSRGTTDDDAELYQAYLETRETFGLPLRLRVGRQELEFGAGWLVGADPGPDPFVGLSFDAIRLTASRDALTLDAWWSKVAERGVAEEDGDIDFMGLYLNLVEEAAAPATAPIRWEETLLPGHLVYHAFRRVGPMSGPLPSGEEAVSFDVYWMHLRDGEARADTNYPALLERIEGALGLDDYDVTALHTVGTRGSGTFGAFDWQAEVAFQWGEADAIGARFPFNGGLYGDDTARWDAWAGNGEIGITLAGQPWTPRIYAGGAWYGGEDHRGISFAQWVNPFDRPRASVSFHRLFSSWREDAFIDGSAMTNFWKAYAGVTALPADRLRIDALVTYLEVIEPFDTPLAVDIGHWRVPVAPGLPFLAQAGSKNLGWQTGLWAVYQYSDDLSFEAGWSHYFVGDAVDDGAFIDENGLTFIGGRGSEDADYLYLYTVLEF